MSASYLPSRIGPSPSISTRLDSQDTVRTSLWLTLRAATRFPWLQRNISLRELLSRFHTSKSKACGTALRSQNEPLKPPAMPLPPGRPKRNAIASEGLGTYRAKNCENVPQSVSPFPSDSGDSFSLARCPSVSCPCRRVRGPLVTSDCVVRTHGSQALSHFPLGRARMVAGTPLIRDTEALACEASSKGLGERTWQCGRLPMRNA